MDFKGFLKNQILELNNVTYLSLEEQAKYADVICQQMAKGVNYSLQLTKEIKEHIGNLGKRMAFMTFNITSLGNIAYTIIKSQNKESNEYLTNVLKEFREFWQNDGSKNIEEVVEIQCQKYSDIKITLPQPRVTKLDIK